MKTEGIKQNKTIRKIEQPYQYYLSYFKTDFYPSISTILNGILIID